jgi:hypothetical protein
MGTGEAGLHSIEYWSFHLVQKPSSVTALRRKLGSVGRKLVWQDTFPYYDILQLWREMLYFVCESNVPSMYSNERAIICVIQ